MGSILYFWVGFLVNFIVYGWVISCILYSTSFGRVQLTVCNGLQYLRNARMANTELARGVVQMASLLGWESRFFFRSS